MFAIQSVEMGLSLQKNNVKTEIYSLLTAVIDVCFHVKMFALSVEMVGVTNVKLVGLYRMANVNPIVGMEL